jgi:hypothetical protein
MRTPVPPVFLTMRAVLLAIVVAAGHAGADPPKKMLPNGAVPEGTPPAKVKLPDIATDAPAFGGGTARGIVIDPGDHPDARAWPFGMVIVPPDPHDPMVVRPDGHRHLGQRTLDLLNDGFDVLAKLLRPHT